LASTRVRDTGESPSSAMYLAISSSSLLAIASQGLGWWPGSVMARAPDRVLRVNPGNRN